MCTQQTDAGLPVRWDPTECRTYIVEVVGKQERFPERQLYHTGSITLQSRLHHRYGADYAKSCSKLLRDFLEDVETGTPEEQSIWHEWRMAHGVRVVRVHSSIIRSRCQQPYPTGIEVAYRCKQQEKYYFVA